MKITQNLLLLDNEFMVRFQITPQNIPGSHTHSLLFISSPRSSCMAPDWQMATADTNICVDLRMNTIFSVY